MREVLPLVDVAVAVVDAAVRPEAVEVEGAQPMDRWAATRNFQEWDRLAAKR